MVLVFLLALLADLCDSRKGRATPEPIHAAALSRRAAASPSTARCPVRTLLSHAELEAKLSPPARRGGPRRGHPRALLQVRKRCLDDERRHAVGGRENLGHDLVQFPASRDGYPIK